MNAPETMASKVEAYLRLRRQAGFTLKIEGQQLARFACFADNTDHQGPLTLKLATQWATASRQSKRLTAARRIEVLRPFARYCQQFEPDTEIPPRGLFGRAHRRLTPHIFMACEISCPLGGLRTAASTERLAGCYLCRDLRPHRRNGLADLRGHGIEAPGRRSRTRLAAHPTRQVRQVTLGADAHHHDTRLTTICTTT